MNENKQFKILIVDDEKELRETFSDLLEMEGYKTSIAENGYEAIDKVKNEIFDLIFLDIKMPGISGIETFYKIKEISPSIPVFFITAYAKEPAVEKAIEDGACGCLIKPLDLQKIFNIIEDIRKNKTIKHNFK